MLKNLNIRTRLRLETGVSVMLLFTVGIFAVFGIKIIDGDVNLLVRDEWPTTVVLDELRNQLNVETITLDTLLLTEDPVMRRQEFERITATRDYISTLLEMLGTRIKGAQGEAYLNNIKAIRIGYLEQQQVALELLRIGARGRAATLILGKLRRTQEAFSTVITSIIQYQNSEVEQHGIHASSTVAFILKVLPALLLGAVILLILITRSIANSITRPVIACVTAANQIAVGDFAVTLDSTTSDETGTLQGAMARMVEAIKRLIDDTGMLTQAAIAGNLSTRADPARHQGDFRMVVSGVNSTLDAVIGPLNVAAEYVERIATGAIPPMITDPYRGDFLEIKNNLNTCITIMDNLLTETLRVIQAAEAYNLDERADAELFRGDWQKLVTGVNTIISTIVNEVRKNQEKERKLIAQEKMASIGQLAAGVAHEINNPMAFITSNLRTLAEYFEQIVQCHDRASGGKLVALTGEASKISSKSAEMEYILADGVELITESLAGAERVLLIVRDLKSFSRVDAPTKEWIRLSVCLESALNICYNELNDRAAIRKEYLPTPEIYCNSGKLNQVFLNLLRNAGQAIVPPGVIVLRSWSDNAFVYASVSDSGSGIPEGTRARIFEPFFTTKDVGEGTGLGLYISYDIIKNHKGDIWVESDPGKGSTFTVKIPLTLDETG